MKKEMMKITLVSCIALVFLSKVEAQVSDTVKIKESKETIITYDSVQTTPKVPATDTVVKVVQPVQEPKNEHANEDPRFRPIEFGIRYMPTFSSMTLRTYEGDVVKGETTMSNGYGVMLGVNSRHVGLQGEVNYLKISQKYRDRNLDRVVDISYLNIPVLLSLNTDKSKMINWNVVAGPQFGINIGAETSSSGSGSTDSLKAVVAIKKGDVGLAYGTGLEFMLNKTRSFRLDLGFRGFYGLVDMSEKTTGNDPNTYNVVVKASRKAYGGYLGLTFLF